MATNPDLAPETNNSEQDDEQSQAHTVAQDAERHATADPTASTKVKGGTGEEGDEDAQDLVDHMRDMESSGRIDMRAYRGEPNMDDEDDRYGEGHDPDLD